MVTIRPNLIKPKLFEADGTTSVDNTNAMVVDAKNPPPTITVDGSSFNYDQNLTNQNPDGGVKEPCYRRA